MRCKTNWLVGLLWLFLTTRLCQQAQVGICGDSGTCSMLCLVGSTRLFSLSMLSAVAGTTNRAVAHALSSVLLPSTLTTLLQVRACSPVVAKLACGNPQASVCC